MMIIASWILAVASGWRPIACMAPLPIMPRPMPEPMAATPMPSGSAKPSAVWKSMSLLLRLVSVMRRLLVPVTVIVVRKHEEEVNRAEHREHERLDGAHHQGQEHERQVE